jgi:hypothetical protein
MLRATPRRCGVFIRTAAKKAGRLVFGVDLRSQIPILCNVKFGRIAARVFPLVRRPVVRSKYLRGKDQEKKASSAYREGKSRTSRNRQRAQRPAGIRLARHRNRVPATSCGCRRDPRFARQSAVMGQFEWHPWHGRLARDLVKQNADMGRPSMPRIFRLTHDPKYVRLAVSESSSSGH